MIKQSRSLASVPRPLRCLRSLLFKIRSPSLKIDLGIAGLNVEFDDLLTTALTALSARFERETTSAERHTRRDLLLLSYEPNCFR
jgi:hypothetical protein